MQTDKSYVSSDFPEWLVGSRIHPNRKGTYTKGEKAVSKWNMACTVHSFLWTKCQLPEVILMKQVHKWISSVRFLYTCQHIVSGWKIFVLYHYVHCSYCGCLNNKSQLFLDYFHISCVSKCPLYNSFTHIAVSVAAIKMGKAKKKTTLFRNDPWSGGFLVFIATSKLNQIK